MQENKKKPLTTALGENPKVKTKGESMCKRLLICRFSRQRNELYHKNLGWFSFFQNKPIRLQNTQLPHPRNRHILFPLAHRWLADA